MGNGSIVLRDAMRMESREWLGRTIESLFFLLLLNSEFTAFGCCLAAYNYLVAPTAFLTVGRARRLSSDHADHADMAFEDGHDSDYTI